MLLVALTGNFGMGKSTVLPMFEKLGAVTLSSDKIVESLLKKKDVLKKIRECFGEKVFDRNGSLNKKKVAELVFRSDVLKKSLEDILHPLVFERIKKYVRDVKEKDTVVVIEMPVLYERGYENRFDRTVVVYTDEEVTLHRLEKDGIQREEAILRLKAQLSVEGKIRKADFTIDNNGTLEETMVQVEKIYKNF